MAGERTLPGLGLRAFWTPGSNGWNDEHDPDTRLVSILCQCAVISRTTALPGSPTDGDIYIVRTGDPNENEIAARDNGSWVYIVPQPGFMAWVENAAEFVKWDGAAWSPVLRSDVLAVSTYTASRTLAIGDKNGLVRMNSVSAMTLTVPDNSTVAFPVGTIIHVRQVAAGQVVISPAGGVTVNSPETLGLRKAGSSASLIKVATNVWDLTGDLEPIP